jgi:hypothetical protein
MARKKDEADWLRALIWWEVVCMRAGVSSPIAVQRLFTKGRLRREGSELNGKWRQYAKGRVPQWPVVELVNERFPGTMVPFCWWLWLVIRNPKPSAKELSDVIISIRPSLAAQVLSNFSAGNHLRPRRRYRLSNPAVIDAFWRSGKVKDLTALLALVRYAEYAEDDALHAEAAWAAMHVFFVLALLPPFYKHRHRFFALLKERFLSREYDGGIRLPVPDNIDDVIHVLGDVFFNVNAELLERGQPTEFGRLFYWSFNLDLMSICRAADRARQTRQRGKEPRHSQHLKALYHTLRLSDRAAPRRYWRVLETLKTGRFPAGAIGVDGKVAKIRIAELIEQYGVPTETFEGAGR